MKYRSVVSCNQMIEWEKRTLAGSQEMAGDWMKRASMSMARWLLARDPWRYSIIFAGPGGNGGDAWALARWLHQAGWDPLVVYFPSKHPLTPHHQEAAQSEGVRTCPAHSFLENPTTEFFDLIIDGILGIGARGSLPPLMQEAVSWANQQRAERIAIDCPSGWPTPAIAFRAHHTLCIHTLKKELLAPAVRECTGELHRMDIGVEDPNLGWKIFDDYLENVLPPTARCIHKYLRGVVYVVAGSESYAGSAKLAERGAWWLNPGMVYLDTPFINMERSIYLKEAPKILRPGSTLVVGPGLGRDSTSYQRLKNWLSACNSCAGVVLDGDGLWHLSQVQSIWSYLPKNRSVLTPHEGELNRLLAVYIPDFSEEASVFEKVEWTLKLCHEHQVFIVFKGPVSYLCCPNGEVWVEPYASPQLAIAGSGDLLAGMIGSFIARGLPIIPAVATCLREHIKAI